MREVYRPEDGLEGVGEDRVLVAAPGHLLAAPQPDVRAEAALAQLAGHVGEHVGVDQARADLGEVALGPVGVRAVEVLGHHELEHGVAEELEPLVVGQAPVLVRERPVGQGQLRELGVQRDAEQRVEARAADRHRPSSISPSLSASPAQRGSTVAPGSPETPSGAGVVASRHSSSPSS